MVCDDPMSNEQAVAIQKLPGGVDALLKAMAEDAVTTKATNAQLAGYLREHLTTLLEFKDTADFDTYGFGVGGPHNWWLTDLQMRRAGCGVSSRLKGVATKLEQLGLQYSARRGRESDYTRQAVCSIRQALG